jgi:hypothetical protein
MPRPPHRLLKDSSSSIAGWRLRISKRSLWSFLHPCYFVPLGLRYPRQPGILERRQPVFVPHCEKLKTVCYICLGCSLITFCMAVIQLRRLRYVSFALHSKNWMFLLVIHIPCHAWEARLTTARINAVLAQRLTHRIIKLHIGTALC